MTRIALAFSLMLGFIIVLADVRMLGPLHSVYDVPYGDKAGHFLLFGVLELLVALSVCQLLPHRGPVRLVVISGLVLAALISLEEFTQIWLPARNADWLDLIAGYSGITFGAFLAWRFRQRQPIIKVSCVTSNRRSK